MLQIAFLKNSAGAEMGVFYKAFDLRLDRCDARKF